MINLKVYARIAFKISKAYFSAWRPLNKYYERFKKSKETGDLNYIYQSELDKASFTHDAASSDLDSDKDLVKRIISDRILRDRAYENAKNSKCDGYKKILRSLEYKIFDKKIGSGASVNEVLAQTLHKPVIKKFRKRKVYARFNDNIWGADLAEMGLLFSFYHGVK